MNEGQLSTDVQISRIKTWVRSLSDEIQQFELWYRDAKNLTRERGRVEIEQMYNDLYRLYEDDEDVDV